MAAVVESAPAWADAEDDPAPPAAEMAALTTEEPPKAPEKPKIALTSSKKEEAIVEAACDAAWTSAELAAKCCDALVASGKLRATPAFIRTDREAKLVKIFEAAKLDGAKVLACTSARDLEVIIRNATQGETWVDAVQATMKTFLPAEVQRAVAKNAESDQAKKVKEAYRGRVAEGKTPSMRDRPERLDGEDAFASFSGRSGPGGGGRACFNCGQPGHIARDCPEPQRAGGGRPRDAARDEAFASFNSGGSSRQCYNCGQTGHISRDCPNQGARDDAFASFGGRSDDRNCYNCGQPGHISRDCPNAPNGGGGRDDAFSSFGGGGGGDRTCYNCGQPGHISRDCPNGPGGGGGGGYGY